MWIAFNNIYLQFDVFRIPLIQLSIDCNPFFSIAILCSYPGENHASCATPLVQGLWQPPMSPDPAGHHSGERRGRAGWGRILSWGGAGCDGYYSRKTMASSVRTTAMVLRALLRLRPGQELESGAVEWLMSQRQRYGWGNTNETAYTILALTDYLLAYQEQAAVFVEIEGTEVGTAILMEKTSTTGLKFPSPLCRREKMSSNCAPMLPPACTMWSAASCCCRSGRLRFRAFLSGANIWTRITAGRRFCGRPVDQNRAAGQRAGGCFLRLDSRPPAGRF
jgi:hypothetical protein